MDQFFSYASIKTNFDALTFEFCDGPGFWRNLGSGCALLLGVLTKLGDLRVSSCCNAHVHNHSLT